MSVRVTWSPSTESDVVSYDLESATSLSGPWVVLTTVANVKTDPAKYSVTEGVFFYEDPSGGDSTVYRLTALDAGGNRSIPSQPFKAAMSPPIITNVVKVDHNYGGAAYLRYQTAGGTPIEGAMVRVYKKVDFDLGQTDSPLAVTLTNVRGEWTNPLYLTTGYTYVVQFAKEGLYGPDKVEVTV